MILADFIATRIREAKMMRIRLSPDPHHWFSDPEDRDLNMNILNLVCECFSFLK